MRQFGVFLLCVAGLACGGKKPSGEGSVGGPLGQSDAHGTIEGQAFGASDALSYVGYDGTGNSFLTIWVTSFDHACGLAAQNEGVKSAAVLVLDLSTTDEQGKKRSAATQPGEYVVGAGTTAAGTFAQVAALRTDAACRATPAPVGQAAGRVTLSSISSTGASGTFDVTFGSAGDHVSGAFQAVACPAALQAAKSPSTICK